MTDTIDMEVAIETLKNGTHSEQVDTLGELSNQSNVHPEIFDSYLDDICPFADNEDRRTRLYVATILANVARHEPSLMFLTLKL